MRQRCCSNSYCQHSCFNNYWIFDKSCLQGLKVLTTFWQAVWNSWQLCLCYCAGSDFWEVASIHSCTNPDNAQNQLTGSCQVAQWPTGLHDLIDHASGRRLQLPSCKISVSDGCDLESSLKKVLNRAAKLRLVRKPLSSGNYRRDVCSSALQAFLELQHVLQL